MLAAGIILITLGAIAWIGDCISFATKQSILHLIIAFIAGGAFVLGMLILLIGE